jgi:hypothetical protein
MPAQQNVGTAVNKRGCRQAYNNKAKFIPHKYDVQNMPDAKLLAVRSQLCCRRCALKIQWKVDYGKYAGLVVPRRCNSCTEKTLVIPYHHVCQGCARALGCCAKCQLTPEEAEIKAQRDRGVVHVDDSASDEEEIAPENMLQALKGCDFGRDEESDDELQRLRGLDVSRLRAKKMEDRRVAEAVAATALRERERRTLLRQRAAAAPADDDEALSSDEEEL